MSDTHDLEHLVRQATVQMSADYERMRRQAREDPGTSGDQGEQDWADLLSRWLPSTFHVVTKGRIVSWTGESSRQVDVLVLSPSYPMGLLNNKLYIAPGVLAAFECKRTLLRQHVRKAVRTNVELSHLVRSDKLIPHKIIYGLLAHSHQLASKRRAPEVVLGEALVEADKEEVTDPRDCLDFVCVPNLGTWSLLRTAPNDRKTGDTAVLTSYMGPSRDFGSSTDAIGRFLTGLLRRLGSVDRSMALIARYFDNVGLFGIGQGAVREWRFKEIPEELRTSVV